MRRSGCAFGFVAMHDISSMRSEGIPSSKPHGSAKIRLESAAELLSKGKDRLPTGCECLDAALDGGLPAVGITEICGEAGAGKTQFALRMIAEKLKRSMGTAVYISTEGAPPTRRLLEMVEQSVENSCIGRTCCNSATVQPSTAENRHRVDELMDRVFVKQAPEIQDLLHTVTVELPRLCKEMKKKSRQGEDYMVRLVVVDSVAASFRSEFSTKLLVERSAQFARLSEALRALERGFGCNILVVNQVSASNMQGKSGNSQAKPALGLSWSNCINSRVMLSLDDGGGVPTRGRRRRLEVVFSPVVAQVRHQYYITACGPCGRNL